MSVICYVPFTKFCIWVSKYFRYIVYPFIFMLRKGVCVLESKYFILCSCKICNLLIQTLLICVTILMFNYVE